MLILLPVTLLIISPIISYGLSFLRPKTGIHWLVSALTALIVWLTLMLLRLKIPESISFGSGKSQIGFSFITTFLLDKISWPYAWALSASLLAMIMTAIVYRSTDDPQHPSWTTWPVGLLSAGLGLAAIIAGNLNTLILAWTAIDLFLLYLMLVVFDFTQEALVSFAIRVAGTFVAIGAVLANSQGTPISFPLVNSDVSTWVFVGSLIRLASIGVSWKSRQLPIPQQGLKSLIHLVLIASVLIVITRSGSIGISPNLIPFLLVLISLFALVSGLLGCLTIKDTWWRYHWIMGFTTLAIMAALRGEMKASLAWGVALLLPGSIILYYYARMRSLNVLLFLGLIGISALPFTPAWQGIRLYPLPGQMLREGILWLIIILAQGILTSCYILSALDPRQALAGAERWVWIIYPLGLAFLPVTQIIILIFGIPGLSNDLHAFPPLVFFWVNLAVIALAIGATWITLRTPQSVTRLYNGLTRITPYGWCERAFQVFFHAIKRFIQFFDQILEGEGGILWTILFLLLVIALLLQFAVIG
jgi:hypothetical protein